MRCESNRRKRVAEGMFSRNDSFQAVEEEFDGWEAVMPCVPAAARKQIRLVESIGPEWRLQ
jgi:hypothetical protein